MGINRVEAQRVRVAAEKWAKDAGFASASAVPLGKAAALIEGVAEATKLSLAKVQEALLAASASASERASAGAEQLGTKAAYQGAGVHTPLVDEVSGPRPMAALVEQKIAHKTLKGAKATGDIEGAKAKSDLALDTVFHQTLKDFDATRLVLTRAATPKTVHEVTDAASKLLLLFNALDGSRTDKQVKQEIVRVYKDLLSQAARGKGVFVVKSTDERPLPSFLRTENDPTVPDRPERSSKDALGRGSSIGFDATSGTPFVYEQKGEVLELASVSEFVARRQEKLETDEEALKLEKEPKALADLRSFTDKEIDNLGGKPEYVTLLEDEKNDLTRVYATRWAKDSGDLLSRRVVVEGPFKGIFLDDIVNELAARRKKGVDFDPLKGQLPTTPKEGEPFITTTRVKERGQVRERLMIRVPENRAFTEVRRMLRRLTELDPSVKYKRNTGNTTFLFAPEHYKLVRDIVKGTVVSGSARDLLQSHFDELSRIELVTADKNLARFTPGEIGGFKTRVEGPDGKERDLDFTYWQKKSIAWLASNDYKGVIALGTGMGKTLVALGAVQHLKKEKGEERPLLVVGPPGLGGNMAAEAYKFLKPDAAKELVENMVFMDFAELSRAVRSGQHEGKPFKAEDFGAVVIDEAHKIANRKWVAGAAALALKHEHKIVMTASAMTRGIDETLTLIAIANNKDLNDRVEGKDERYQMRKFTNLHFNIVGGRAVGVTEAVELQPGEKVDPKHNMHSFIRANVLFADKRMDDHKLTKLTQKTEILTMPPKMEAEYRKKARSLTKVLRGMVSLYRDQGVTREYVDDKGRTRKEINPLARQKRIAEMFGNKLRGTIHALNEITNTAQKLDRAAEILQGHLEERPSTRAVLFSDSADYVRASALEMSKKIPGKIHAACFGKSIHLYRNGKELTEHAGEKLPFTAKAYTDASGRTHDENQWHKFVLDQVIGKDRSVATTSLFAPVYQEGQNLQWAEVGIHLDRDTWSSQNMEQREGRIWRKGQDRPVAFYNLDWVYRKPADNLDRTLDEVRKLYDDVNQKLFHDTIVVPQKLELGGEWEGVREQDELRIDTGVLELALEPSLRPAAERGGYS